MPRVAIFYVNALFESQTEQILLDVVIPSILLLKGKANINNLSSKLREILRTTEDRLFDTLTPEILAAMLDIDYNILLDTYIYIAERYTKPRPSIRDILDHLRKKGYKIIVYTYSDPTWEQTKITVLGLDKYIDQIINIPLEDLSENATIYTLLDILIKRKILKDESEAILITTDVRDYIVARELNVNAYLLGYKEGILAKNALFDLRDIIEYT